MRAALTEPEALVVAVALMIAGLNSLLRDTPPSLTDTLPGWVRTAWAVTLFIGGAARTVGLWLRWLRADAAGCALLTPAAMIYGAILLGLGRPGLASGLIVLAIGLGSGARLWLYHHATAGRRP